MAIPPPLKKIASTSESANFTILYLRRGHYEANKNAEEYF